MNRWITILLLILLAAPRLLSAAEVPRMDKDELRARLGSADLIVLDVRQPADWEGSRSKITGAVRADPRDTAAWAIDYNRDKTLVLYCT